MPALAPQWRVPPPRLVRRALRALGEPSGSTKAWFLVPVTGLVLAFVWIAYARTRATRNELKRFTLWPIVPAEYVDGEMQNEAWKHQRDYEEQRNAHHHEERRTEEA